MALRKLFLLPLFYTLSILAEPPPTPKVPAHLGRCVVLPGGYVLECQTPKRADNCTPRYVIGEGYLVPLFNCPRLVEPVVPRFPGTSSSAYPSFYSTSQEQEKKDFESRLEKERGELEYQRRQSEASAALLEAGRQQTARIKADQDAMMRGQQQQLGELKASLETASIIATQHQKQEIIYIEQLFHKRAMDVEYGSLTSNRIALATLISSISQSVTDVIKKGFVDTNKIKLTPFPQNRPSYEPSDEDLKLENYKIQTSLPEGKDLSRLQESLLTTSLKIGPSIIAKYIGLGAVKEADRSLIERKIEQYKYYFEIGKQMLDISLGFIPGVGWARDVFEAVSGKNLITGDELSTWERTFALAGAVTGGVVSALSTTHRIATISKLIPKTTQAVKEFEGVERTAKNFLRETTIVNRYNPVNPGPLHAMGFKDEGVMFGMKSIADTFRSATYTETLSSSRLSLYHLYDGSEHSKTGFFWTRVKPLGPTQGSIDFAITPINASSKNTATHWVEIVIPANQKLYEGVVESAYNPKLGFYFIGGSSQVYLSNVSVTQITSWIVSEGKF